MNKLLIVGGTGYLGRQLRECLHDSYEIYYTGRAGKGNKFFQLDIELNEYESLIGLKFDLIIYLIGDMSGVGVNEMKANLIENNTINYCRFLDFVTENNLTDKFIFVSSMTVYSVENQIPVPETGNTKLPPNIYGFSKKIGEEYSRYFANHSNIKTVSIRIPGLYGGDRKGGYIFNLIRKLKNNETVTLDTTGLTYWECVHVRDISNMIVDFFENYEWKKFYDTFNLGYGEETDFVNLAHHLKERISSSSEIREISKRGYVPFYLSNRKAKKYFREEYSFHKSLITYLDTFEK